MSTGLGACEGKDIFGCATRTEGLARIQLDVANAHRVLSLTAPSVDLIDVTSLRSAECPFAVAGLSLDCSLVFVRDILSLDEQNPGRLRFDGLRGTPYSLLSAKGHIFLLTSAELVILPDLASRFLDGAPLDSAVHVYHTPVEAVEAFIASDRYLLTVTDEGVRVSEISAMPSDGNGQPSTGQRSDTQPWRDTQELPRLLPTDWGTLVA
jgi:hypothetical protein